MSRNRGVAARSAQWSVRHRKLAVIGWLTLVVLATAAGTMMKTVNAGALDQTVGESGHALRVMRDAGLTPPASESVLIQSASVSAGDTSFRSAVADVVSTLKSTSAATTITSPYVSGAISADRHSALVTFEVAGDAATADSRIPPVQAAVKAAGGRHPGISIDEVGEASATKFYKDTFAKDFASAEWTAVPVALGILLIAFAGFVAASLPVGLALTAIAMAAGFTAISSHLMPSTTDASSVMLLVGLAVGVDYCLFYLRRSRTERASGHSVERSISIAAATSGHSVLVSGVTVVAAMSGLFLTQIPDFKAIAAATIIVVIVAVGGSLTVLPALLSMLGDRVDKGRIPILGKRRQARLVAAASPDAMLAAPGGWRKLLDAVLSRPLLSTIGCIAVLLALAAPTVTMHTAQLTVAEELSSSTPIVRTASRIDAAFPGSAAPATVTVQAGDVSGPAVTEAVQRFDRLAVQSGHAFNPRATVHPDKGFVVIRLQLAGTGTDPVSTRALAYLRSELIPATFGQVTGAQTAVAGTTAQSVDFGAQLRRSILPVFAFVLVLAFGLMLLSFRSVTIAATTVVLNLLSVGAAYGVLTLVFQHNWGGALLGADGSGAINTWVPIFLFVLLFGLSMDYHVFVVSRIKEGHDAGLNTRQAIADGISSTASAITSAAMIMVGVFAIFATLSVESMKQVGVGLGVAVLIDATLIRGVLLPAVMVVLGESNWYLPRWLGWVPDLSHSEAGPDVTRPRTSSAFDDDPAATRAALPEQIPRSGDLTGVGADQPR
ncbi:MAG TPA: MMPL family transporter [Dermatophilaceae bacterium]|nr:MMPL family transporter [Dermatophilaceae bacterium]